jgi:purine-binding chemotaxis protein CheW
MAMQSETSSDVGDVNQTNQGGLYLTFGLGGETFGVEVVKVQEIIQMTEISSVPNTPDYVRGVLNLRGRVIPVIDLRRRFGMEDKEDTERTCMVVFLMQGRKGPRTVAAVAEQVNDVAEIPSEQIEPPPALGQDAGDQFLCGMAKTGSEVVMLVDIDTLLGDEDLPDAGPVE